jgi:AcrR family transcriptional regulator
VPTATTRLSREAWIDAALDILLQSGPDGVAVQPLARQLGTTKGSFYWHFSSRDDLLRATLERWESVATDDVIAAVEAGANDPRGRAELLVAEVTAASEKHPGELLMLAGTDHPEVRAAIERVTQRRIDYLARLLRSAGLTPAVAQRRATLGYAAYLGHAQLARSVPAVLPQNSRGRHALAEEMADALLG